MIDMTGQRIGILVVESRCPKDGRERASRQVRWNCRCDVCKGLHQVLGGNLRSKEVTYRRCPATTFYKRPRIGEGR